MKKFWLLYFEDRTRKMYITISIEEWISFLAAFNNYNVRLKIMIWSWIIKRLFNDKLINFQIFWIIKNTYYYLLSQYTGLNQTTDTYIHQLLLHSVRELWASALSRHPNRQLHLYLSFPAIYIHNYYYYRFRKLSPRTPYFSPSHSCTSQSL